MAASREKLLLEKGAKWRPDEPREIQWVHRNLLECEPDVTVELIEQLMKHTACTHDPIHDLLRTPAMKKHLTPVARKFGLMGFHIRTKEQKAEDERRADEYRSWAIRRLASTYDREKIYEEIWSEPIQRVAKRYDKSDVGLAKVLQEAKHSAARTRLLGHEGGRQAYSKTTSTSGLVHAKAKHA